MDVFPDLDTLVWAPVRPDLTRGVIGRVMLDGPVRAVVTRVAEGGTFPPHVDRYAHLFWILSGTALVRVGDEERRLGPGTAVRVPAGVLHGYENPGPGLLELLSFNLPPETA